jgi:hypothetical protein
MSSFAFSSILRETKVWISLESVLFCKAIWLTLTKLDCCLCLHVPFIICFTLHLHMIDILSTEFCLI